MNDSEVTAVLNRLLHVLCRSLPMYLAEAKPFGRRRDQPLQEALASLVADQHALAGRVSRAISERGGRPEPGRFPIEFTGMNDVAIDFLLPELVRRQGHDVEAIQRCVADLVEVPDVRSLAEETLRSAKGHLDALREMTNDQ